MTQASDERFVSVLGDTLQRSPSVSSPTLDPKMMKDPNYILDNP